jgi:hypothetical protein
MCPRQHRSPVSIKLSDIQMTMTVNQFH